MLVNTHDGYHLDDQDLPLYKLSNNCQVSVHFKYKYEEEIDAMTSHVVDAVNSAASQGVSTTRQGVDAARDDVSTDVRVLGQTASRSGPGVS